MSWTTSTTRTPVLTPKAIAQYMLENNLTDGRRAYELAGAEFLWAPNFTLLGNTLKLLTGAL